MDVAFRSAKMPTFAERTATYRENPASKSLTAFPRHQGVLRGVGSVPPAGTLRQGWNGPPSGETEIGVLARRKPLTVQMAGCRADGGTILGQGTGPIALIECLIGPQAGIL
jgi:hypothetical protein